MTETPRAYRVGDHVFALDISPELIPDNYEPFLERYCGDGSDILFSLAVMASQTFPAISGDRLASFADENGSITLFSSASGEMTVRLAHPSGHICCHLTTDREYRHATAILSVNAAMGRYGLDTALMMQYSFASARHSTLLVHAAAVEHEGSGFLFLGRSGTGKSTHARLWTEHIPGSRLLNDDNPVVRLINGEVRVYGSPWSGKTPCHINRCVPVKALVRLHQAPDNRISRLDTVRAYAALLPSCSCMRWDHRMADAVHTTVSRIAKCTPVFSLDCVPAREAALLCRDAVAKKSTV